MGTYRSKPTTIEAIQWKGDNFPDLYGWTQERNPDPSGVEVVILRKGGGVSLYVAANDAWLPLELGEWVAKDKLGFYPIKDEIFSEKYEEVVQSPVMGTTKTGEPIYRSEYFGEFPASARCDYGSCGSRQVHLGPHRCGACGRPCDDPEVTCEVHKAGWPHNPEKTARVAHEVAKWSSGLNARLAKDD